jgi:transposase
MATAKNLWRCDVRERMNGIMDILRPGCPWRSLSILPCR